MIRAAGILLLTGRDGRALFLQRADTGEWAFPGGHIEADETAEQAAERELREEIGAAPHSNPTLWMRRIKADVDFTTFLAKVDAEFTPTLNDEHTAWTWAPVTQPPEPLHPGARVAIDKLSMDELGIARAIAAGDLTSPQRYGNFVLWDIRITGTGLAYRMGRDEFCWRDPAVYLNDEFLARCNGLPVVFEHPDKKPTLDSEEFNDRIVGTVFVPYIKGDEVWAVARIYDGATITLILDGKLPSTSPGVLFTKASGNKELKQEDGSTLLLEGKPALLDHIALVDAGVWDKLGPPTGISTVTQEPIGMTEEEKAQAEQARKDSEAKLDAILDALTRGQSRMDALENELKARRDADERKAEEERKDRERMDAARKDRFGTRKDGESYKDYRARHDADEAAMCDALEKGGVEKDRARRDAKMCRMDAEAEHRKDETFAKWAEEEEKEEAHKDKARKDAEEQEERERTEREDRARKDAQNVTTSELAALRAKVAEMEAHFKPVSAEDRTLLADAQARADGIEGLFGRRASPPSHGERPIEYRRRLATQFKQHSPQFKGVALDAIPEEAFGPIEQIIYADAAKAAHSAERAGAGVLVPIRETDAAGRTITKYTGDPMAWMQHFCTGAQVGRIRQPNELRH